MIVKFERKVPNGETAHLEAELSTLSKPAKVIKNYLRASEQGREVFFIVENGNASKLANILEDSVNRNGDEFRD